MASISTQIAWKASRIGEGILLYSLLASSIGLAQTPPSKEYIYAGSRLVAVEKPSQGAPTSAAYAPPPGSNGSGLTGVFSFSATDPDGAGDIKQITVVANNVLSGWGGCYFYYYQPLNQVFLSSAPPTGTPPEQWMGITVGSSVSSGNHNPYCSIRGDQGTEVIRTGNTLTLKLNITFNPATFSGTKTFWTLPIDNAGGQLPNAWATGSTWTWIVQAGAPTSAAYAPPSGSNGTGLTGVFSFSVSDPDGAADILQLIVVANSVLSGSGGCYFFFYYQPS